VKQFLERMTLVQSGGLELEALYHQGRGGLPVVIAPPHPSLGGSMDHALCAELAWALSRAGHATLRFNYRGVGASQGKGHVTTPSADEELEDLAAAARQLAGSERAEEVGVAGYSLGAFLAARLVLEHPSGVARLALVAPPTRLYVFDFAALSATGTPVLVVAGGEDRYVDAGQLEEADRLHGITVHRVPEVDHGFQRGLVEAGREVALHMDGGSASRDRELPDDGPSLELDRGEVKP
jgi:hypothetical protein